MILVTESTAGPRPSCLACGARASFIELHARFVPSCHCHARLVTREGLERDVEDARETWNRATADLAKFLSHLSEVA